MTRYMKRHILAAIAIVTTLLLPMGCSSSDDDETVVISDNCYITSFTLGQMRRALTVTSSTGSDSTYYLAFSGSYYPMTIDQRKQTISLATALPERTCLDAVLTTLTYVGAVVHAPENDTTEWTAYDSKDTIDFTSPRIYRVYSTDGSNYRDYTVSLYSRTSDPDDYTWTRTTEAAPAATAETFAWEASEEILAGYDILAHVAYTQSNGNERVLLACQQHGAAATTPLTIWSLLANSDEGWTCFDIAPDNHYTLTAEATLHLVAADNMLVAFMEGKREILVSHDNGITWKTDSHLTMPDEVTVLAADGTPATMNVTTDGTCIWLVVGEETWKIEK